MAEIKKKANLHSGHRKRMRDKFIKDGNLDMFDDYQLLEMLLFYAYPMRDTNEIAHTLINQYGSLHNLFNRPPKDLINNGGLTENVAVLLTMMPYVFRRYLKSEIGENEYIDNSRKAKALLKSYLIGYDYELFVIVSLDVKKRVISVNHISSDAVSEVKINYRGLIEKAILNRARYVLLGHNHPGGTMKPSKADVNLTLFLKDELKKIDIAI
ncbi:MAG: RadC family protein, partial [Lachnospirales bacterium]